MEPFCWHHHPVLLRTVEGAEETAAETVQCTCTCTYTITFQHCILVNNMLT